MRRPLDRTRVALLGCGGVATRYRSIYRDLTNSRVVVAVDISEEQARNAALACSADRWSTRVEDAFDSEVEAVVISTPNYLHREHAIAAINAGKHVLLQKPMARNIAEAEEILRASEQAKQVRSFGIYMNMLDNPLYWDIRELVASGRLGRIVIGSARLAHRGGLAGKSQDHNWRASTNLCGGGSFLMLGLHYIHLLQWILNDRITSVSAVSKNLACKGLEGDDVTVAQLEFSSGTLGSVQSAWCVREEHLSLLGTHGGVHYQSNQDVEIWSEYGPFQGRVLNIEGNGRTERFTSVFPPRWDDARNPFNQHRQFLEAVQNCANPTVSASEGLQNLRVVNACYEASIDGCIKTLDLAANPKSNKN
jgi:predicted dehydrogenase